MKDISEIREQASDIGVFFPLSYETEALETEAMLHEHKLANRNVLQMQPGHDADADGKPGCICRTFLFASLCSCSIASVSSASVS